MNLVIRPIPPLFWVLALSVVEVFSFFGWVFPTVSAMILCTLAVAIFIFSLHDLRLGVVALATELIIGSQGYLFVVRIFGFPFSLRLALFCAVMCATVYHIFRAREIVLFHKKWWVYAGLMCVGIIYGIVNALIMHRDSSAIFFDVNAWLFLAILFPLTQAIRTERDLEYAASPFIWALWWLAAKSTVIFILFSHPQTFQDILPSIYRWLRDDRIAEIFRFDSGFARVFLQSHIYALCATITLYIFLLRSRTSMRWVWVMFIAMTGVVLMSYSRTFWLVGIIVALLIALFTIWRDRMHIRRYVRTTCKLFLAFVTAVFCVYLLVRIPIPYESEHSSGSLFVERIDNVTEEPAAVTRMQQLVPLWEGIMQHPFRGSGFGATITYRSADPRIMAAHPDGVYTTSAFEWAYLDFIFKLGFIGVLCICIPLVCLFFFALSRAMHRRSPETIAAASCLLVLLGVHILTPYINHPLGIFLLVIIMVYLDIDAERV